MHAALVRLRSVVSSQCVRVCLRAIHQLLLQQLTTHASLASSASDAFQMRPAEQIIINLSQSSLSSDSPSLSHCCELSSRTACSCSNCR